MAKFWYKRRYGNWRKKSSSSKMKMTKNFKASAYNMTQGGTFNISVVKTVPILIAAPDTADATFGYSSWQSEFLNIPQLLFASDMHVSLSSVFDQYRILKASIKVRKVATFVGNAIVASTNTTTAALFSAVDRSGFPNRFTLETLRTYGSFKETQLSGDLSVSPTHYITCSQSNSVEFTEFYDTKRLASFPIVLIGVSATGMPSQGLKYVFNCEIDAQVRYRGVRYDNSPVGNKQLLPAVNKIKGMKVEPTRGERISAEEILRDATSYPDITGLAHPPNNGNRNIAPGHTLVVFRPQSDGSWKIGAGYVPTTAETNGQYYIYRTDYVVDLDYVSSVVQLFNDDVISATVYADAINPGESDSIEGLDWYYGVNFNSINQA